MFSVARKRIFFHEKFLGIRRKTLPNCCGCGTLWVLSHSRPCRNAAPAGQAPQALRGTVTPGKVRNFMKKIFRTLTLCLVLFSLLCAAVPAAFAAGDKEDTFYTIGLDACGGVSSTVVVTTNLDGKLTTLPESPTMDGYTFNGWYTEPVGGSRVTTATVFTGDTTIYAQWTAKSSSASTTTPTLPVTGGPALQKHLGTLLVAGILVTLVVVAAV